MIRSAAIIVPPLRDFYFTRHRFSTLGADIVATLLERAGIRATVLNFPLMNVKGAHIDLPTGLAYLKPFIIEGETGRLSFFTGYRRFGPDNDTCARMVTALLPDLCFFSLFAFCYAEDALSLAARFKRSLPGLPLVIGGAGASANPDYFLRGGAFDFVLPGEAEACLPRFLEAVRQPIPDFRGVPGLLRARAHGDSPETHRRASLNVAAADEMLLPLVKTAESARTMTFATSLARGCPKRCDFCSSSLLFGKKLRTVPLKALGELLNGRSDELVRSGKRIVVNIEDDNLLGDEPLFKDVISLFRKHLPGVEFVAENGLDYTQLTPELCTWLIDSGMRKFNLSLASTSPAILRNRGRGLDLECYEKVLALLAGRNIPSVTYVICGFGEDRADTVADSLRYLADKPTLIGLSPFYPVPGLPGFSDPAMFDALPALLCCGSSMYPWNGSLSTATMVTAFRLARLINLEKSPARSDPEREIIGRTRKESRLFTLVKERSGKAAIREVPEMDGELIRKTVKRE
jgi:hypothetical protein